MQTPEELLAIVKEANAKYPADIQAATAYAEKAWRDCEGFAEFVDSMVTAFIRDQVCRRRHNDNTNLKKAAGVYGQPHKIGLGTGATSRVCDEWLDGYAINGVRLGDLIGSSLLGLAKSERNKAEGCAFNARLCETLAPLVPADKTVRQALSPRKVKKIVETIKNRKAKRELATAV